MYLAIYNFEIMYYRGASNPADRPSRHPDYINGPADMTWLSTFQNKLKGAFTIAIQAVIQATEKSPLENELIILAISTIARGDYLLYKE